MSKGVTNFELGTDGPKVIMVGLDGTPTSWHAADYAAGLARRQSARLVVVHVRSVPPMAALAPMGLASMQQAFEDESKELKRIVMAGAEHAGIAVEFVAVDGDPYNELVRVAGQMRAEAVVVGASSQAGHRLIGSIALRLVRAGRWPVTVVP